MADDSVRVAVRVRPLVKSEIDRGSQNIINVISSQNQVQITGTDKAFTFNYAFDPSIEQLEFYNKAVKNVINNLFQGYNVTILAYGQTGSGKTHSMGTSYVSDEAMGVIPRAIEDIFNTISTKNSEWNFKVSVSFMELYKEQLYDLLESDKQRKDCMLDIREDNKGIKIVGITEKEVHNTKETLSLLMRGSEKRATGSTAMNDQSSRSHAIFTVTIRQCRLNDTNSATTAKFHLVDLAGSERSKKTQATGERFKEGVNINKGLLALGNVISQLGDEKPNAFVSYRESKLTRLLQDSLGGNSITLMIACISPADYNLEETLSTLRYADRAKKIKNKPIINQDPHAAEIQHLNKIINELRLQMLTDGSFVSCSPEHAEMTEKYNSLRKKFAQLMEKFNENMCNILCMNERAEVAENAREKLHTGLQSLLEDLDKILDDEALDAFYQELFKDIRSKICKLLDEQKEMDSEIKELSLQQSARSTQSNTKDENTDNNDNYDDACVDEEHIIRQAERNDQVQDINRALAEKNALITQLRVNEPYLIEYTKNVKDMEEEIKKLNAEKDEMLKALDSVQENNASAKLAETRRKRVQDLEKKINQLTKKCIEQSQKLKDKQNTEQQIKNLSAQIQQLKQTRVKLIRDMRKEAEKFNQYKNKRDKEFYKLKTQECKQLNEIVKMKIQHNKQQIVYKRKLKEAYTVSKRLKEALEMQKEARKRRDKATNSKEEIGNWLKNELFVLHSIADSECSRERLINDRELIAKQLNEFEENKSENTTPEVEEKIKIWKEHLELRNAEILDFQQKLIESERDNKSSTSKWQSIQSMGDAQSALNLMFKSIADNRKKYFNKCSEYDNLKEKCDQLELKLQEEFEKMQKTLSEHKQVTQFNENKANRKTFTKRPSALECLDYIHEESVILTDYDSDKDPEWTEQMETKRGRTSLSINVNNTSKEKRLTKKRSSAESASCACTTKCGTRLCFCREQSEPCNENCQCKPEYCKNKTKKDATQLYFDLANKREIDEPELDATLVKRARIEAAGEDQFQ